MNQTATLNWDGAFGRRVGRMGASESRELLKVLDQPGLLSFAGGIPDPNLFPKARIAEVTGKILGDSALAACALQYSTSEGYLPLRGWIVRHMARRGVECGPDNIVITAGSQQALDFVGKLLVTPGDTVLVTAPTYLGALQAFNADEPRYDHIHPGGGNTTPAAYRAAAAEAGGRLAYAYAVPDLANPTGQSLAVPEREALLGLCAELGLPLVEDAAYEALRFEGEAPPSLLALDIARAGGIERSRVIHCGTFPKTVPPAFRVGWICASSAFIRRVVLAKQAADLQCATLDQMIVHRVAEAEYEALTARAAATYRGRRDAMLAALARHMRPCVAWTRPEGGMFVWLTLPEEIDSQALLAEALEAGIAYVLGCAFFSDRRRSSALRLSYSLLPEAEIEDGMGRLAAVVRRATLR